MNKFKAGDKVYCPMYGTSILMVTKNKSGHHPDIYPLMITVGKSYRILTNDGKIRSGDKLPALLHATPENHALLEQLYGDEFEAPPAVPTSKEIVKAYLDRGDKRVCCWVSNMNGRPTSVNKWVFIDQVTDGDYPFVDKDGRPWAHATPFDRTTLQPITELPT